MATPKYRPSLTASQITILLSLLRAQELQTKEIKQLTATLSVFEHKITLGVNAPAYVESSQSTSAKLGFSDEPESAESLNAVYEKFDCNASTFTSSQLSKIREYRYINDLMSIEEEIAYTNSLIVNSKEA